MVKYIINIDELGKKISVRNIDVRTPCSISVYSDEELDDIKRYLFSKNIEYNITLCDNIEDIVFESKSKKK